MKNTWWKNGEWNAICDVCGFRFKSSDLSFRWDGLMVCREDWETRHPQEMIRPVPDQNQLPWTRPQGTDQFIDVEATTGGCSVLGQLCQADFGSADCMIVDNVNGGLIP